MKITGRRYRLLKPNNVMFVQRSSDSPKNIVHANIDPGESLNNLHSPSAPLKYL